MEATTRLFSIILWMLCLTCFVKCGTFQISSPNFGAVGKSVTLHWTYVSEKDPINVIFYVRQKKSSTMHKTWQIDFSSSGGVVREIQVSKGLPEAVFNNITKVMFEGRKTFKLTVEQIPSSIEEFVFICQATESIWSVPATSEVEVTLASEPKVDFQIRNSHANGTQGGQLEMSCTATGLPLPNVKITKQNDTETVVLGSAKGSIKHSILSLKPSDGGKYLCTAENIAGSVAKEVLVTVKYKPVVNFTIVNKGNVEHAVMGSDVQMYCTGGGFPVANVAIFKIVNSNLVEIEKSSDHISYTISNIQPNDAATYVCVATNSVGSSRVEKIVTVQYIEAPKVHSQNLLVKFGSTLELECNVVGFPVPSFVWFKDSKKLADSTKILNVNFKEDESYGTYTCVATNSAGTHKIDFKIEKPYIKKVKEEVNHILKVGENKTLNCEIEGNPTIKHTWYKGKNKLSESKTIVVRVDSSEKFGNYTCVGKNEAGEEMVLFNLQQDPIKKKRDVYGGAWRTSSSQYVIAIQLISLAIFVFALGI